MLIKIFALFKNCSELTFLGLLINTSMAFTICFVFMNIHVVANIYIYVTVNLCNQGIREFLNVFREFTKFLNGPGNSRIH